MTTLIRYTLTLVFLVGAAALSSGAAQAQTGGLPAEVRAPTWTLTAIQGPAQDLQDLGSVGVTLRFGDDGRATGQGPCNGYSATVQAGGGATLTFGPVLSTKRACVEEGRNTLETEYFNALSSVSAYTLQGNQLQLTYNNGSSTLQFTSATVTPPGMPTTGAGNLALILAVAVAGALLVVGGLGLRARRGTRAR
jgi:heat shock protein HslJ